MNESFRASAVEQFQQYSSLPWLMLLLFALPLCFAAWRLRIVPTMGWIVALTLNLLISIFSVFHIEFFLWALAADWLLIVAASIDFIAIYTATNRGISVSREIPHTCSQGVQIDSLLTVENRSSLTLLGQVRDDTPHGFESHPESHSMRLPPTGRITFRRKLTPSQRGAFRLEFAAIKFTSPLRLWTRYLELPLESSLNVYPDMKQLGDYAMLARTNRLSLIGVRRTRRIGQDSEFERLRDYSRDDNFRHIDWRSTARRNKLTVRQFQSDQSQRVIFLIDCGRMMTASRDGFTLLDHALNACLMMAYVALHQGDSVGMLCFSDSIHAYIPPRGGQSQMNRLLHAGFDQFPRMVESRYDQAFLYLRNHCKRRSLVALTTNVIDEVNGQAITDYLINLRGQHLPLGVILRDRTLFEAADHPEGSEMNLYRAAAAADILIWRDQVLKDLEHRGVLLVDSYPDELTAPLVNQYLEVKAKHLL
ncbi:DUF58 domain-containing protein [Rhodopirellula sp. MGV]|uniref:DUF58 domain-containing protein n=1 Tax=Rhodopirellula sp. MGV TaxID=2023130 RepID=UPI000B96DA09|nr:DUF58 domain-containing protein [Rhodopirellula sp. MGV]OYP35437.1 DUF58 domain-containing protein [Rhodopirellula sp. MGV]PNY33877.1 DUF58 domain-containing protein [Rhodopirellula baltica]